MAYLRAGLNGARERAAELEKTMQASLGVTYQQIEALLSLMFTIHPSRPLPAARGWAASPDLLNHIAADIFKRRPRLVFEASSGLSTLVAAHCVKRVGVGQVVSLEHDAKYEAVTRELIALHGLEDVACIVLAPLKEFELGGEKWLWYDLSQCKLDAPIDLFIVDGPPGATQPLARYPALPLLYDHLAEDSVIMLDDGDRSDEKAIAARWTAEFEDFISEHIPFEKGAFVLRRAAARAKRPGATTGVGH